VDQDLIVRAQAGEQRAFDELTLADYPRLFRVAQGILRDRSHAEDATQQAYLDIWRNIRRLREPAKFEAWSYRLLVHACYAEAKRIPKWLPDTGLPERGAPQASAAYGAVLDRDELEHGFGQLSVDHRVVIVMHFLLDMTLEQVAITLDLPQGTVNSRLSRGMDAMRAAMGVASGSARGAADGQEVVR
jgi:RNA polymerase sigma-70 factor (ECF subfamily)